MRVHYRQTFAEDEARNELQALVEQIAARHAALAQRWRLARPYDRLLAVRRLLAEGSLEPVMRAAVQVQNERAGALWARIRALQTKAGAAALQSPPPRDLPLWRHAITTAQIDLQRAEATRDRCLAQHGLWDDLFTVSESFLLSSPYTTVELPLRELLSVQAALQERLLDFARCKDERARDELVARTKRRLRILPPEPLPAE